jgi:hypothetical protein
MSFEQNVFQTINNIELINNNLTRPNERYDLTTLLEDPSSVKIFFSFHELVKLYFSMNK